MKNATEVDHLAAIETLASGRQTLGQTLRRGVAWGVGHTLTLMIFGGIVRFLGKSVPVKMERALELAVGAMLIVLGLDVMRRLLKQADHFDARQRISEARQANIPGDANGARMRDRHDVDAVDPMRHDWLPARALVIGMVHGMAGTAALTLLSSNAVQSVSIGIAYILLFGLGSVVGMSLLSTLIAIPLRLSANRPAWMHQSITVAFGFVSLWIGASMVYQIGFVEGLLF